MLIPAAVALARPSVSAGGRVLASQRFRSAQGHAKFRKRRGDPSAVIRHFVSGGEVGILASRRNLSKEGEPTALGNVNRGSISMSTPIGENPNELREAKADERRARMASDLDRLEALITRLERDRLAQRLPRAAHLPPVPGLSRAGERFDDDDRPPAWLKPEQLPISPAMMRRRERASWGWPVGILVASVCVLSIAYYLVGGWQPRSATDPQLASIAEKAAVPQAPFAKSPRILAQDDGAEPLDANELTLARRATASR